VFGNTVSASLGHRASKKSADNTGDKWHYLGSPKSSVNQVDDQDQTGRLTSTLTVLAVVRDGAWHELEDNS
jgi:hypothetical protein